MNAETSLPIGWRPASLGEVLLRIDSGDSPKSLDRPANEGELGVLKVSAVTWGEFRAYENKALPPNFDATGCEDHPTIARLKHNQPITTADLEALETILFAADGAGNREQFQQTYGTDKPLGKLIREIVGLDPNAGKQAFAQFLTLGTLSADQITFINQIIDHLIHNGTMDHGDLFKPPFTDMHDQGLIGVLPQLAQSVVQVIRQVNENALVA